jgi:hypothetical protein
MDADQLLRIVLTVVTPILTAGLGIVALVIGDWRERRTQAGQRKLAFEEASRQVAFAAEWLNASKLVADSPEAEQRAAIQAQAWLNEASAHVAGSKQPPSDDDKPAITLRRLLLAYPIQRRSARNLRAAYYFFLGFVFVQVGAAMGSALGRPDTIGIPDYFSAGVIYSDLITVFVLTVIAMAFRFLALRVEQSEPTAQPPTRLTLRRALLLYRFNRPAARIASIVFYFWTALTVVAVIATVLNDFEDPRLIPGDLVAIVALVGWAAGLRYWAVSLNERGRTVTEPIRPSPDG